MSSEKAYRPEIDGIRAIAVLSVIWYHAGLPSMPGGFLGVDVFFAISGYLITGIIVRAAEAKRFSVADFYMRRVRRIIPALVVVTALTLPFAWWLMLPDDLENHGQAIVATMASMNNVLLWFTSDYFSLESEYKPLVHTWSLGVEEQYYLIVPLILALAIRFGRRNAAILLLSLASVASLGLAEWLRHVEPNANFYLLPSRFWELGLGGIAALAEPRLRALVPGLLARRSLAGLGLVMLVAAFFVFDKTSNLPGAGSLLPVVGTALVLLYADMTGVGRLLAAWPMRWIGLISYSAYLYHQPVFAFIRIASLNQPSPWLMAASIPAILVLAWLSWRFVERPFRDPAQCSGRKVLAFSLGGSALLAAIGAVLYLTSGFRASWPELADGDPSFGARQNATYVQQPYIYQGRPLDAPDRADNILVIGNSFARDFINMGQETGAFYGKAVSYDDADICDPSGLSPRLERLVARAGAVVLGSGVASGNSRCTLAMVRQLERAGVTHVVVLGTKNFGFNNNAVMLLPEDRRYQWRTAPLADVVSDNVAARRVIPPRYYVDLLALMDDGTGTVPVFTPERKFISQDRKHLTRAGAAWLGRIVFAQPQFAFLRAPSPPSAP